MEHKVLTLNGQGSIPKNLSVEGMDLPMKRRHAIQKIISDEKPDIILMQESKNCDLDYICNQDFGNKKYTYVETNSKKDAAIIYDSTKFKRFENPTNTKTHILNMKPEISKDADLRMCAVILQEKCQNRQPFLCATWHGPSKIQYGEKKKIYRDLCLCLGLYLYEKQIPVILGGDFNLDLMSVAVTSVCWPSTKPVCYNIVVNDYPKLENRPNKIDYILTSETFTNVCCTPIHILDVVDSLFPYLTLHYAKAILGNDVLALHATSPTDTLFLKSEDKVLVMNAKKLVPDNFKIKGEKITDLRMEVMYHVILDENPDIILIQESNFPLNNICTKLKKYKAVDEENLGSIFQDTGEVAENQAIGHVGGEVAKNQAIGHVGGEVAKNQAIGHVGGEVAENQAIGHVGGEVAKNQAIGHVGGEVAKNQAIGHVGGEVAKNQAIGHVGGEVAKNQAIGHVGGEVAKNQAIGHVGGEVAKNQAIGHVGGEVAKNQAIGHVGGEVAKNQAIGHVGGEVAKNQAIGHFGGEVAKNQAIGHFGGEVAENQAIDEENAESQAIGGEDAQNKVISGEDAKNQAIGEDAKNQAIGDVENHVIDGEDAKNQAISEGAQNKVIGGEDAQNQAIGGEDAQNQAIGGEDAQNQAIGGEDARMYQAIGGEDARMYQAIGGEDARIYQAIGGEDARMYQAIGGEDARMYQAIGGEDAGIIFNTKKFDVHTSCEETKKQLSKLYVSKYGYIQTTNNEILKGICAVTLKQKCSNAEPFLCVSCHGSHFNSLEKDKVDKFSELFIYQYSDEKKIPVILGKDFNLEHPNNPYRICISHTNNSLRGTKNVDTKDIIDNIDISCKKLYLCLKMVLDHDPLICSITQPYIR
ncbi:uncharacterized protein [Mytilus edulis]|uniref:uncharacterized protein n=1 Tax=Mytilus edulis TaxID=6550 RepID=UPI0039F00BD1